MKDLITLLQSYDTGTILTILILLVLSFFGITEIRNKIKEYFDIYYKNRSDNEHREQELDTRIENLEKSNEKYDKRFDEMTSSIEDIKTIIVNVQNNQNRANIATARSAMYRLANELISKNWMSQTEYETLSELSEVYNMSGGPRHSKSSLIKRALDLPVLTDEEIRYKKFEEQKELEESKNRLNAEE